MSAPVKHRILVVDAYLGVGKTAHNHASSVIRAEEACI
jgi:hypothetical protein